MNVKSEKTLESGSGGELRMEELHDQYESDHL